MLPASFALKGKVRFILTESGLCKLQVRFFFPEVLPSLPVCLYQEAVDQEIMLATLPPAPTRDTHTLRHTRNSLFSPKQTEFLHEPDSSPASIWSTFRFGRNQKPPLLTFWTALYFFRFFFSVSASFCLFFKLSTVLIHTFLN